MKEIHDIRQQIPQFAANHFPQYKYEPYPRMMVNKQTGKPYLDAIKKPVVVDSMEAEIEFWASKGFKATLVTNPRTDVVETTLEATGAAPVVEQAKAIEIPMIASAPAPAPVRAVFEALTPAQAEKAAANNETVRPKRKYTRKLPANLK